jgi:hypothetical protein
MIPLVQEYACAIAAAKAALEASGGRFWLGNPGKVEGEFFDLGLLAEGERRIAVDIALCEITAHDRKGPEPPDDYSSHPPYKGIRLFAFKWRSNHFMKVMYFKFGFIEEPKPKKLAIYSIHEDRYNQ